LALTAARDRALPGRPQKILAGDADASPAIRIGTSLFWSFRSIENATRLTRATRAIKDAYAAVRCSPQRNIAKTTQILHTFMGSSLKNFKANKLANSSHFNALFETVKIYLLRVDLWLLEALSVWVAEGDSPPPPRLLTHACVHPAADGSVSRVVGHTDDWLYSTVKGSDHSSVSVKVISRTNWEPLRDLSRLSSFLRNRRFGTPS